MRTERAIKNTISSVVSYFLVALMAFVVQRVFRDCLGKEYLGISGLYMNIMSGLGIIELGFGSAIVTNMYKPVASQDIPAIRALIQFYKKVYRYIAYVVLGVGLLILPFVDYIVGETIMPINTKLIFLFYLTDVFVSYFLTYKRSMLYANQQSYYTTWVHTIVLIITNCLQIVFLLSTKNYYLYLITSILFRVIENIAINIFVNHMYPYLKMKDRVEVNIETKQDIKKKVHGLIFHKVASFVVTGTDNIIISMVPGLGIIWVGVYSSYSMITTKVNSLIDSMFNSVTASVGNLLVENNTQKSYRMFCNIKFLVTWIYVNAGTGFFFISFPFVELWMGRDFVLDHITVLVITINLIIGGGRAAFGTFKTAAGIFYEDRYVPLIEACVNLVLSIPLAMLLGLKGVFIGTICSNMVLYLYSYPKYVYKLIFKQSKRRYIIDCLKSVIQFLIAFTITAGAMTIVPDRSTIIQLIWTLIVCTIVPNLMMVLLNFKTEEFKYFRKLLLKLIFRKHV